MSNTLNHVTEDHVIIFSSFFFWIITCQPFAQFVKRGRNGSKYGGPKGPTQTKKETQTDGENITKQKKKGC